MDRNLHRKWHSVTFPILPLELVLEFSFFWSSFDPWSFCWGSFIRSTRNLISLRNSVLVLPKTSSWDSSSSSSFSIFRISYGKSFKFFVEVLQIFLLWFLQNIFHRFLKEIFLGICLYIYFFQELLLEFLPIRSSSMISFLDFCTSFCLIPSKSVSGNSSEFSTGIPPGGTLRKLPGVLSRIPQ